MAEKQKEQRQRTGRRSDAKLLVSALFASSGAVAPVDFARFGQRVGEIIARAGGPAARIRRRHRRRVSPAAVHAVATKTARDGLSARPDADYRLPAWVFNACRSDSLRSVMTATLRALK